MQTIGVVVFAVGILFSVCLHEAGHLIAAKSFGMKVTRYFVGFGPTLWSFRRGDTEYGIKAIPAGGFVKIVGMTAQDDDIAPEDEPRAMWRFPVWKRTIVMIAGSATHFILGIVILWAVFAFIALPDESRLQSSPVTIDKVSPCVAAKWEFDPETRQTKDCVQGTDPASAAATMGLHSGDTITAINGQRVAGWDALSAKIRSMGGKQISLTYVRDGQSVTHQLTLPIAQRIKQSVLDDPAKTAEDVTPADLEQVGVLGITPVVPTSVAGPVAAVGRAGHQTASLFAGTIGAIKQFPEKVPKLWAALNGSERDPQTPVSVVGASRIGGELFQQGEFPTFLLVLASLNFFVGLFNLLPLLPLDGGHVAVAWFERIRSWFYAKFGRPDPGPVDYMKLMPVTYVVILIFGGFTLLTVAADIINPIKIF
jgi:membrane-associated protease RseP (regulator of RpoE activity)